jgi:hypothetical protein
VSLEKRLDRLENYCPQNRTVKDMTDKELEELICAELGIPASELTEERLEELIQAEKAKTVTPERERRDLAL